MMRLWLAFTITVVTLRGGPIEERFEAAWKLEGQRRYPEAIAALKGIIRDAPDFFRAHVLFVRASLASGQEGNAIRYLQGLPDHPSAATLHALGQLHVWQQRYPDAVRHLEACLAQRATLARCHELYLWALSSWKKGKITLAEYERIARPDDPNRCAGILQYATIQGEHKRAKQVASACAAKAEEGANLELVLHLHSRIGGHYHHTGDGYEDALVGVERRIALAKRLGDPEEALSARCGPAYPLAQLGRVAEAERLLSECLKTADELGHVRFRTIFLEEFGAHAVRKGDHAGALPFFSTAIQVHESIGDLFQASNVRLRLGNAYRSLGRHAEAKQTLETALAGYRKEKRISNEPAWALIHLSRVHEEMGEYFAAIRCAREAVQIHKGLGMEWQAGMATTDLAEIYESFGDYDSALESTRVALRSAVRQQDLAGQQATQALLGNLYLKMGQYAEALAPLRRAAALYRSTKLDRNQAYTQLRLGHAYRKLAHWADATTALDQAIAEARRLNLPLVESEARYHMGATQAARGHYAQAAAEWSEALRLAEGRPSAAAVRSQTLYQLARLERRRGNLAEALRRIELAVEALEAHRSDVPTPELRAALLGRQAEIHEEAILTLALLAERTPGKGYEERALMMAERSRARSLIDVLREPRWRFLARLPARKRAEHTRLEAAWSIAVTASNRDETNASLRAAAETAERALAAWWTQARLDHPPRQKPAALPTNWAALRRELVLTGDRVIVQYALGGERSHAWVVAATGVRMMRLPGKGLIESSVRTLRKHLEQAPTGVTAVAYRDSAAALYRLLIDPLGGTLIGGKTLTIIADGELHHLPFEVLLDGAGKFLVERHAIHYAPSIGVLTVLEKAGPSQARRELLAYGDADYGNSAAASLVRGVYEKAGFRFGALPYSRREVDVVSALFPQSRRETVLGRAATEDHLRATTLSDFKRLHLAVHGVQDDRNPNRSALILSLSGQGNQDGVLRADEVASLALDAELVVLSACVTGLGTYAQGEGQIGLPRAFLHAGARRVVVSLWNVNEVAVPGFMEDLYRSAQAGGGTAEALQAAKLKMIKSDRTPFRHPYFWAPFVLQGLR